MSKERTITVFKELGLYQPLEDVVTYVLENCPVKKKTRHYDKQEAEEIVQSMYHFHNGKKYIGEYFTFTRAEEVYKEHSLASIKATVADVYIALNAQYHDYCVLFYRWFANQDIDPYLIVSAVSFWFRDEDYQDESKVYKYFNG
jgi:hypothetical protein